MDEETQRQMTHQTEESHQQRRPTTRVPGRRRQTSPARVQPLVTYQHNANFNWEENGETLMSAFSSPEDG